MSFHSFLSDLNEEQLRAVQASYEEPLFVCAGAGSGKTRTLICRIAGMISGGIDPENILAISFSKKSTEEIRERLKTFIGPNGAKVSTMTFHRLCLSILKDNPFILGFGRKEFHIADTSSQFKIVKNACVQLISKNRVKKQNMMTPNFLRIMTMKMVNFVRRAKTLMKKPEDFQDDLEFVYSYYQEQLKQHQLIDFNDFLSFAEKLLKQYPRVAFEYRKKYQYILIDEFQDTSIINFSIVKYILGNTNRITIFGDGRQSIYGFRGADPTNINAFLKSFPNANKVVLNKNYRSTQTILNAAQSLITHNNDNSFDFSSSLISKQKLGDLINIISAEDSLSEVDKICQEIEKIVYPGSTFQYRDIVIMFRIRKISSEIEMELFRRNIPYTYKRGVGFFMKKDVRDVIAYIRLVLAFNDDSNEDCDIITNAVESVINVPDRNIGLAAIKELKKKCIGKNLLQVMKEQTEKDLGRVYTKIRKFLNLLEKMHLQICVINNMMATNSAIQCIIEMTKMLEENPDDDKKREVSIDELDEINDIFNDYMNDRRETLELLLEEAKRFHWNVLQKDETQTTTSENLKKFINSISLELTGDTSKNAVTLSTIHQMKGLETPICFIMRFNQGVIPLNESITTESGVEGFDNTQSIEEERRIAYVALTRAKYKIYISYCQSIKNRPVEPSQFLSEISNNCLAKSSINLADKKEIMSLMSYIDDDFDDISIE